MLRQIITDSTSAAKSDRASYAQVLLKDLTPASNWHIINGTRIKNRSINEINPATDEDQTDLPPVELHEKLLKSSQLIFDRKFKGEVQYCRNCGISFFISVASCAEFCEKGT